MRGATAGGLALVLFDLDRFKEINDTEGHAEGDRILRAFAAVLADSVRDSDTVGRLGGDEFGVLLLQAEPWATTAFLERIARAAPRGRVGERRRRVPRRGARARPPSCSPSPTGGSTTDKSARAA